MDKPNSGWRRRRYHRGARAVAGAAEKLGMKAVPVIVLRHLSPAQRRALVIADNQLAIAGAAWDEDMLRIELAILHEEDYRAAESRFARVNPSRNRLLPLVAYILVAIA